jgi:hypothetical protein
MFELFDAWCWDLVLALGTSALSGITLRLSISSSVVPVATSVGSTLNGPAVALDRSRLLPTALTHFVSLLGLSNCKQN